MGIRKDFLPLSLPNITQEDIDVVAEVMRSKWITTGAKTKEFEERFAKFVGVKHAIALTSATAGMHLLLHTLNLKPTDEIITPALTFASSVNQIVLAGAKPTFVDVDYDCMLIDINDVKRKITKHTKAIIPLHYTGQAVDLDALKEIAQDIPIIEDCAHSIGTYYKGKHTGSQNTGIFSFHPIKNITTAEGGMLTTNDDELAEKIRRLRFHGIQKDAYSRYQKKVSPKYDILQPGFKYNMPDILAAIGLSQLSRIGELNKKRAHIANIYFEELKNVPEIDLPKHATYDTNHAYHLFVVKVKPVDQEEFIEMLYSYNIGAGLHFPSCADFTYITKKYGKTILVNTDRLKNKIVSLPLFADMSDDDAKYVCKTIKEIFS